MRTLFISRRDLFYLDGDKTLRSDPPICSHIADVSSSAPNGCPSRTVTCNARIYLSICVSDAGGRRDAVSGGDVVVRPPNGKASNETRYSCLRGCQCDTGRTREQWQLPNQRRTVVCVLFGYRLCYTSDGLSVKEKVNPRMNEAQ